MRNLKLYAFLVSVVSLLATGFVAFFILPKIEFIFRESGGREMIESYTFINLSFQLWRYPWAYFTACGLTVVLFILPLLKFLPAEARKGSGIIFQGWSLILLALTTWTFVAASISTTWALGQQEMKVMFYQGVLDEFSLRESAEGRFNELNQRLAARGSSTPVKVESVSALNEKDRKLRFRSLLSLLKRESSVKMKKQILATLSNFQKDIDQSFSAQELILENARELSGTTFETPANFFEWIHQQPDQEEWKPIPLYKMVK
jgi:hypothetical protein